MSQKKETTVLVLALLLTLLLGGVGAWVVKEFVLARAAETPTSSDRTIKPISKATHISFGEKTLIPGQVTPAKQAELDAIATGKWNVAITNLQQARKENRDEPETLIFLNNAEIAEEKSYTVAASAPLGTDPKGSLEILRGVAQAQNEINHSGGINGVRLKVAIANDNNQEDQANTSTLDKALQVVQVNRKRLKLLGGDDIYAPITLAVGGDAAKDMVIAVPWDIDTLPQTEFIRESKQIWGAEVNWRTALFYDATRAFIAAIQSSPTRSGIQQTLSSPNFSITGAAGAVQFLRSRDRNAPVELVKIVPHVNTSTGYDFVPVRQ